jgi:hypothetical protein
MASLRAFTGVACLLAALALPACGGDSEPAPATPEEVAAKLQEAGFATGEVITDGANMAVARRPRTPPCSPTSGRATSTTTSRSS